MPRALPVCIALVASIGCSHGFSTLMGTCITKPTKYHIKTTTPLVGRISALVTTKLSASNGEVETSPGADEVTVSLSPWRQGKRQRAGLYAEMMRVDNLPASALFVAVQS